MLTKLHGAIAAAVTPLRDGGRSLDLESIEPLTRFLAEGGMDGVLACGTTGEGILLTLEERRRVAEGFLAARPSGFQVAIHAGAQTTADTIALSAHALEYRADAVAVIAPPYFPLDDDELLTHLSQAANACDPLPFYVYEFAGRSGYPIPVDVIQRMRRSAPNLAGLKVSDSPFEALQPYLVGGLDLFVGAEPVVLEGIRHGAVGAVSGLASAWPGTVADLVHYRDAAAHARVIELRDALQPLPFHAALKHVLVGRQVLTNPDVRRPLRGLRTDEQALVDGLASPSPPA
jgi:dihydrodipicolinate synthase/N-acetylneuraminate lyase